MSNITIYTSPTCGFCHMAKEYFKAKKIEFVEKDVSQDAAALEEAVAKSGQMGIPVIDIDGTITVGFNRVEIDAMLAKRAEG